MTQNDDFFHIKMQCIIISLGHRFKWEGNCNNSQGAKLKHTIYWFSSITTAIHFIHVTSSFINIKPNVRRHKTHQTDNLNASIHMIKGYFELDQLIIHFNTCLELLISLFGSVYIRSSSKLSLSSEIIEL